MNFVYHNVPDPMVGTKLIPLNQMSDEMSDVKKFNLKNMKDEKRF